MEQIKIYLEKLISLTGLTGDAVSVVRYVILVIASFGLAWLAGWLCRVFLVPLVLKVTRKTEAKWDDVIFSERVLLSASKIVPAIVIWALLPLVFFEYPKVAEIVGRLTAIYFTVMIVRTVIVVIDSLKLLEGDRRTAKQQYLYTITGVLKILMIFVAAIVVIAIVVNKNPSTLLAGLGAASAVLMLAFQDTIKGLVAGIRLTSNDMLHKGDWITVPSAGANGIVEEMTLTTVKVRNFDNTIVTVTPQTLVDGSFQNWIGMQERQGRKQSRKIYIDFRSVRLLNEAQKTALIEKGYATETELQGSVSNLTVFRRYVEWWLNENPLVIAELGSMVRQDSATTTGLCIELVFWLHAKAWADYEHHTSEIMEYVYAVVPEFGLQIYQQGIEKLKI